MLSDSVVTAPDALKARFFAVGINRQRCLHGLLEEGLTRELLCRGVNLPHRHRVTGLLEHSYHGFEHWAYFGRNGPRFARIGEGFTEQLVVERADPRKLNPGLRV